MLSQAEKESLEGYLARVGRAECIEQEEKIGAIVMNCNPMTRGHLHLIETASGLVDYLYVFIVEEDRSEFSFKDRYAMVQEQTEMMDNVRVVPSGMFILSYETMPIYFEKSEKQEEILDAADDLQIFCQYVAPALGITVRFAGEEPADLVTYQYNEEMRRMLPYYGMEFREIPRLEEAGEVISASKVRLYLQRGDWDAAGRIVPDQVLGYLKKISFQNT